MKAFFKQLYGNSSPIRERLFRIICSMASVACIFAFVMASIFGESLLATFPLLIAIVMLAIMVYVSYKKHLYEGSSIIIIVLINMFFFPLSFFTSGGVNSGIAIWFVLGIVFVFMLSSGKLFYILLFTSLVTFVACYFVGFFYPELIIPLRDRATVFSDSAVTMLIVAITIGIIIRFQTRVYEDQHALSEQQKKQIEELSNARSRFFANMSHEIRTPIYTIVGLNEMTLRSEELTDDIKENSLYIQSASKSLLSLVNDILDLSKMEAGSMKIIEGVYSPARLMREVINMTRVNAHQKNLEFNISITEKLPVSLNGDEMRIKQILLNLLSNAVKYTDKGSVTLRVTVENPEKDKIILTVQVTDTGIGIKKEDLKELFNNFVRFDANRNKGIQGTGLGLAISKQLSELMGGSITVDSVYKSGSTFTLTLPQEVIDGTETGDFAKAAKLDGSDENRYTKLFTAPDAQILVVDDNRMNRIVVQKLLRATKVHVDLADSGKEALNLIKQKRYDLIFMDHLMPEMDGVETLRNMRAMNNALSRKTPVIALTANVTPHADKDYREMGFTGYLSKPIDAALLEDMVFSNLPDELIEKSEIENLTDMDSLKSANIIKHKQKLIITTDSVSDIPEEVLKQHNIMCMPYYVVTGNGRFKDNSEISQSNVIECLLQDKDSVKSVCGSLDEYERFFAQALNLGEKVLHVATSRDISFGYEVALEAAESFGDVTVFDSRQMSAGVGLVALKAAELAKFIYSPEELSQKLTQYIPQISTSFIIPDFSYVEQRRMPVKIYTKLVNSSNSHPVVRIRKGKIFFVVTYMGDYNRTIQRFIDRTLKKTDDIDDSELYIMQMELSNDRLEFIKREIEKRIHFKKIHVLPTSAAIACNSGPESFGLVFERKDK